MFEIESVIHEAYVAEEKKNNNWVNSPYREFHKLSIDSRGKTGEIIISKAIKAYNSPAITIEEDVSDVNAKGDGVHYDIKINGQLIEIKTAYRGNSATPTWQHENLYRTCADMAIFLDFDYEGLYLSVIPTDLLPLGKDSEIFGRKHGTLRKNKDDGYKLDFSCTTFKNLIDNGFSWYFDADVATMENLGEYITERILEYVDSL